MDEILQFRFPTDIRFGVGARAALREFAERFGVRRPLLVTDAGLTTTAAYRLAETTMHEVWPDGFAAFAGVHPNPTEQDVDAAWGAYHAERCDGVVGLGGGSPLDVAKVMRAKAAFPDRPLTEIPLTELPAALPPFCAIPTTAGTGSEVGRSSVITVEGRGGKAVFGANPMLADMAVLDAELTAGLPPHLTASTGMDAMAHAVESFVCPLFHPMCDAIALEAARSVRLYLPRACANGNDLEARGGMLLAAAMGAVAFQKDLGVAHSLSHPLSTEFGVQHGLANALALPPTVRFNGAADTGQYARVTAALGLLPGDDPAAQTAACLDELNRSVGITQRLRDLDVPRERLPELAAKAMADPCHATNPRTCTETDMLKLYEEIW